jgi:hypothetical protein
MTAMIRQQHATQLYAIVRILDKFADEHVGLRIEILREQGNEAAKVGFHFGHTVFLNGFATVFA